MTQAKPERHPRRGSENRQRTAQVAVRFTPAEHAALTDAARRARCEVPTLLRDAFLTYVSEGSIPPSAAQVRAWLRAHGWIAERVNVDAARFFGLLPDPDRGGGRRWSAAVAEEIRARWPEIAAASRCIGAVGLRERGWTEAMIRDLLGKPDRLVDNPHYKSAGPMRLWRLQRVEAAEAIPEFARRLERAERQCAGASKAAETRKVWKALGGYGGEEAGW